MEVTILQWNIWYAEDIRNIAKFLKTNPADIICLQELSFNLSSQSEKNTPKYIAQQLGYNVARKKLPIETTDGHVIHLANGIFTKFEILKSDFVWINEPSSGGGYSDEYRAFVEAEFKLDNKKLNVGTVHMSYTHKFEETEQKLVEAKRLLKHIKNKSQRFLLAGDFNATPDSYSIKEISKHLKNVGPDTKQKTWATKPFSYNGFETDKLDWRLDYIFATPDIKVKSAKILETPFSDHLPILATIEI